MAISQADSNDILTYISNRKKSRNLSELSDRGNYAGCANFACNLIEYATKKVIVNAIGIFNQNALPNGAHLIENYIVSV
ncbi:MAG: hypothetical protein LBT24_07715 [Tannerella sp.]|nr:hypothetical protein [Tannerella sp.]